MNRWRSVTNSIFEHVLPWLVLAVLLTYTYSKFFYQHPGFRWQSDGKIESVFSKQAGGLKVGDQLVQVGPVRWEEYRADLNKHFFTGTKTGDIIPVTVRRNGALLNISWIYPPFSPNEFSDQLFSEWFLAYFFWLAGILSLTLLRPRDERWFLLSAFNFLTALWLIAGSDNSAYHILYSPLLLRFVIWLCLPVYLHLHWSFPRPFSKLPLWLTGGLYGFAILLGLSEWFQILPQRSFLFVFLFAVLGSLILIIAHYLWQPQVRQEMRVIFIVAILAILPSILWGLTSTNTPAGLSLLSFLFLPFSYLYAAYRRQLGNFELRVNRFISLYFFVILLGTVLVPLIVLAAEIWKSPESAIFIPIGTTLITTAACLLGYPRFQNFVETRWLGIRLPPGHMQEIYSSRITTSTSIQSLIQLLRDEVFPSLFIREYLFIQTDNGTHKVLLASNWTEGRLPSNENVPSEEQPLDKDQTYPWARLILPLSVGEDLIGLWLLGRRDPDDTYSQDEIPILQSLANQTAVALSNILQANRLQAMYQANINRNEQERLSLALDLHDSVLNQMAAMIMELKDDAITPGFQRAYDTLAQRLREIVFDLRPPTLNYGLKLALEELADHLMERSNDEITVIVDVASNGERFPMNIEQHIFRIIQEACENAVRHARAKRITISGTLKMHGCDLTIEDDGIGFDRSSGFKWDDMLASKHYGLIGMVERARLIGAEITFDSSPESGTRIRLKCKEGALSEDESG